MLVSWVVFAGAGGAVAYFHFRHLLSVFKMWNFYRNADAKNQVHSVAQELIDFSREYYQYSPGLEKSVQTLRDSFLREAIVSYLAGAVRGHEWLRTLRQKAETYQVDEMQNMHKLERAAAFLPAIGWCVGLSSMYWFLMAGNEGWVPSRMGVAFSYVLASIVYGLILHYVFIEPTASRLQRYAEESRRKNGFLIEGLSALAKKSSTLELYEAVNLMLPPNEKLDMKHFFNTEENKKAV
jgi:flagellar motor component MotA